MKGTIIVACHPDDEALSTGGLIINRLQNPEGMVNLLVVFGRHYPDIKTAEEGFAAAQRQREALKRSVEVLERENKTLNPIRVRYLEKQEGEPTQHSYYDLLRVVEDTICTFGHDEVVIPSDSDLNQDHRFINDICKIALRPSNLGSVKRILMAHAHDGGTPATMNWAEPMTVETLSRKIEAIEEYKDEVKPFPHARSRVNIEAHAQLCGSKFGIGYAEPYTLLMSR